MIEYLLSRLIVLEQNGENTVIFTVNLEHTGKEAFQHNFFCKAYFDSGIEDPSSPAISFGVLGEVVGLKGEEDYFAQIAQQIHDIVIGPVLEKPAAFRSSIEKSDKKLVCTMKASDKDKSYSM